MKMEEMHWTAPIWTQKKRHPAVMRLKPLPYLDSGSVGPSLHFKSADDQGVGAVATTSSDATESNFLGFRRIKDVVKEFPVKRVQNFAYPILPPTLVNNSKQTLDFNSSNAWLQGGNCLDVVEWNGEVYVVHPREKDGSQKIFVSTIQRLKNTESFGSQCCNDLYYKLKTYGYLPSDETVCQIVSKEVNNEIYVLYRSLNNVHFFSLHGGQQVTKSVGQKKESTSLVDVALNHSLPGVWAASACNETVYVYDAERNSGPLWQGHFQKKEGSSLLSWCHCDFGQHPLSLVISNKQSLWLCDTRLKCQSDESKNGTSTLLDINTMEKCLTWPEEICCFTECTDLPYVYVVATESVLVVDERYAKLPVMKWQHMLPQKPSYLTKQKVKNLELLMIGNMFENKVCMIGSEWVGNENCTWCKGTGLPKHFDISRDTLNFGFGENLWFGQKTQERLRSSWIGLASFKHPVFSDRISLLSLNKFEDIFVQPFDLCYERVSKSLLDNEENAVTSQGKDFLKKWDKNVMKLSLQVPPYKYSRYIDGSVIEKKLEVIGEDIKILEILRSVKSLSPPKEDQDNDAVIENSQGEPIWSVKNFTSHFKTKARKTIYEVNKKHMQKKIVPITFLVQNYIEGEEEKGVKDDDGIIKRYLPKELSEKSQNFVENSSEELLTSLLASVWESGEPGSFPRSGFSYRVAPHDYNFSSLMKRSHTTHGEEEEGRGGGGEEGGEIFDASMQETTLSFPSVISMGTPLSKIHSKQDVKRKVKKSRVEGF